LDSLKKEGMPVAAVTLINLPETAKNQSVGLQTSLYELLSSFGSHFDLSVTDVHGTDSTQITNQNREIIKLVSRSTGVVAAYIDLIHQPTLNDHEFEAFSKRVRNLALSPVNIPNLFSWIVKIDVSKTFLDEHQALCNDPIEKELIGKSFPLVPFFMYLTAGKRAVSKNSEIIYLSVGQKFQKVLNAMRFLPVSIGSESVEEDNVPRTPIVIRSTPFFDQKNPLHTVISQIKFE
jgi:hypothetical protein